MHSEFLFVYIVFTLIMACVFELIDRVIKAISNKAKAKRIAEAEKPADEEEV